MIKKKVLVTYGWCRTSYVAVKSLSRAGYDVYVCDSSSIAMSRFSRYVKGFYKVGDPFVDRHKYRQDVSSICSKNEIDFVLPAHEDGVFLNDSSPGSPLFNKVVYVENREVEKVLDKFNIMEIARNAGVPIPETRIVSTREEAVEEITVTVKKYGVALIKPRWGNSGKGVEVIRSKEEAVAAIDKYEKIYGDSNSPLPLIQEFVTGDIYGACFLAINGDLQYYFGEKYLRCKSNGMGTSVLREPCHWGLLEMEASKLVKTLGWNGLGHFDFIGDGKLNIRFLEMNPRLWGGINNAVANGFDFPAAIIAHAENTDSLAKYFNPQEMEKKSLWVLGGMISILDEIRCGNSKRISVMFKRLLSQRNVAYDDFSLRDPIPFFAQCMYYFVGFVRNGGNVNPDRPEMM